MWRSSTSGSRIQRWRISWRSAFDLRFRQEDFSLQHEVPFYNASRQVFQGLRGLLDDQVAPERRPAALVRLRKYAGMEPGASEQLLLRVHSPALAATGD